MTHGYEWRYGSANTRWGPERITRRHANQAQRAGLSRANVRRTRCVTGFTCAGIRRTALQPTGKTTGSAEKSCTRELLSRPKSSRVQKKMVRTARQQVFFQKQWYVCALVRSTDERSAGQPRRDVLGAPPVEMDSMSPRDSAVGCTSASNNMCTADGHAKLSECGECERECPIFSSLNNLEVITTSSPKCQTSFGFTQREVDAALDEMAPHPKSCDVARGSRRTSRPS